MNAPKHHMYNKFLHLLFQIGKGYRSKDGLASSTCGYIVYTNYSTMSAPNFMIVIKTTLSLLIWTLKSYFTVATKIFPSYHPEKNPTFFLAALQ